MLMPTEAQTTYPRTHMVRPEILLQLLSRTLSMEARCPVLMVPRRVVVGHSLNRSHHWPVLVLSCWPYYVLVAFTRKTASQDFPIFFVVPGSNRSLQLMSYLSLQNMSEILQHFNIVPRLKSLLPWHHLWRPARGICLRKGGRVSAIEAVNKLD